MEAIYLKVLKTVEADGKYALSQKQAATLSATPYLKKNKTAMINMT